MTVERVGDLADVEDLEGWLVAHAFSREHVPMSSHPRRMAAAP
jgi:hypothetical protein